MYLSRICVVLQKRKVVDGSREVSKEIEVWDTPGSRKFVSFAQLNSVLADCDVRI